MHISHEASSARGRVGWPTRLTDTTRLQGEKISALLSGLDCGTFVPAVGNGAAVEEAFAARSPCVAQAIGLVRRLDPIGMTSLSAATPILCFAVALPKS